MRSAVELVDDLKGSNLNLRGFSPRREQAADLEVGATTRDFGDQRIGCLLDAVVEEPIGTL